MTPFLRTGLVVALRAGTAALAAGAVAMTVRTAAAQQLPDTAFRPPVPRPAYATNAGPRLCLDEAHNNFHTLANRFWAFGELARRDGYKVAPNRAEFSAASLRACDILVISNAQNPIPWGQQPVPTPSAFKPEEIVAVRTWVDSGGALLLIADHQPLAGAARDLAAAFGAQFTDGFAYKGWAAGADETAVQAAMGQATYFVAGTPTLPAHPISLGRDATERVTQVQSFTGQAFRLDLLGAKPVLVLPDDFVSLEPRYAWAFDNMTPVRPVGGWLQGATLRPGRGRVAFFGEAAMFSAQVAGPNRNPMGMNAPTARQNPKFVLNTLHWLSGLLDR